MNKRFIKFISMILCLVMLMLLGGTMVANATETGGKLVRDQREFISALKYAKEGDIILVSGEIVFTADIEAPKNQVIVKRTSANDRLITSYGIEVNFSNMIFEGMNIKSDYPILTIQGDSLVENCTFQNCGDPEFTGSSGCIGGAVRVESGTVVFENCKFNDNSAIVGGHLYIRGDSVVSLKRCTMTGGFAVSNSGAIGTYQDSACYIDSCLITENETYSYGGGIGNRSYVQIINTKLYNNKSCLGGADIGNAEGAIMDLKDTPEQLIELFKEDNIIPKSWVCDYDFEEGIFIPDIDPTIENSLLKLEFEYKEPEQSEETEKPKEDDSETEPNEPTEDKPEEMLPSDDKENVSDQQPEESTPSNPNTDNSTEDNSSTTGNIITDNSSTDNSTSSNHESTTTDNSRYSNTTDSNNTSTINNNYYTQPKTQTSNNQPEVQTIVVPVGNAGNDEPLQQTISIQGSPEGNSSEGMTLNVNVNIGSEDAADQEKSIIEQSGVSWYQVAVLCLLSLILGCVIKRP